MTSPTTIKRLRELLEKASPGEWEIQDSCSWRRIGTPERDGNVLCPCVSRTDGHPDLMAGRGEDVYDNLRLIVEMKRHLHHRSCTACSGVPRSGSRPAGAGAWSKEESETSRQICLKEFERSG